MMPFLPSDIPISKAKAEKPNHQYNVEYIIIKQYFMRNGFDARPWYLSEWRFAQSINWHLGHKVRFYKKGLQQKL